MTSNICYIQQNRIVVDQYGARVFPPYGFEWLLDNDEERRVRSIQELLKPYRAIPYETLAWLSENATVLMQYYPRFIS
jgi:hypothetical protein